MQSFVNANVSFSFTVENKPVIPSACLLPVPMSEQEGVVVLPVEHEKPTSVLGSQFTASGLILVG